MWIGSSDGNDSGSKFSGKREPRAVFFIGNGNGNGNGNVIVVERTQHLKVAAATLLCGGLYQRSRRGTDDRGSVVGPRTRLMGRDSYVRVGGTQA